MFPRTKSGADRHRKAKREREISISFQTIVGHLPAIKDGSGKRLTVLEFGSGQGFQIPELEQIGELYASDIYVSERIKHLMPGLKFTRCSMVEAPFKDAQFDIIYSNHVLEHIEDIEGALKELRRIGKNDCIFAFSVPTNIWLILALPAIYYNKLRSIGGRILRKIKAEKKIEKPVKNTFLARGNDASRRNGILSSILPQGHGVHRDYLECYRFFKIKNWVKLFEQNNFEIIKRQSLLFYAPSEWPIVPVIAVRGNRRICSSVLFLLKKSSAQ